LKQAFTAAEWTAFGINDLKETDFALAGGTYYKPMPLATSKDPLSDAQYEKYTASAQCTDSTCTSPNGEGGNDCIADGIDGGIVNWQSRLMVREPMTCSGTDKGVCLRECLGFVEGDEGALEARRGGGQGFVGKKSTG